ncbi:hypothetical protein L6164_028959 [Bauhinia variegata]|uniref:Uncharacterized protein n=1 Tax=Bauhinia variegata TaxID=167791 RepID=A0ACB9L825_BAUVA|nr:hypothetical protein L6164_028959 [Bauhinia variegata]
MAIQIIIQESHVGKFSRLWLYKDIDHVLTKDKGTEAIHGIVYSSYKRYKSRWNPNAFLKMRNVKLLKFKNLDLPLGLNSLPEGLKYLEWEEFPLQELPLGVQLDEVVELKMHCSKIKTLWRGTQSFRKLKFIDLRDSKRLIRFPSVLEAPCVERLVLEGCINLVEVHKSVGQLKMLKELNLRNCVNLKILPNKLEMSSLKNFILSSCSKLKRLPEFGERLEFLEELDLSNCRSLVSLPRSIDKFKSLRILYFSGCSKALRQPENLKEVLPSIMHLKYLKRFSIPFGWMLGRHHISSSIMVPPISCFPLLKELDLSYCDLRDESLPPEIGCLSSLIALDLSGNNFTELPASCIANLSNLRGLILNSCAGLKSMPKLPPNIEWFFGLNCPSLVTWSDQECLPDFFATHSDEGQKKIDFPTFRPILFFPGTDIPPWFSNQMVKIPEQDRGVSDSEMSMIVEIPDYCLSSERWDIAVCLVLENHAPASTLSLMSWSMELPGTAHKKYGFTQPLRNCEKFFDPHLCTFLMGSEYIHRTVRPHLKCDQNKLRVSFMAHENPKIKKLKIRKCGWRVVCKEDLQVWWGKARSEREQDNGFGFDMPSTSSIIDLHKARIRKKLMNWQRYQMTIENYERRYTQ